MIARVNAPLPREAEPALTFDVEQRLMSAILTIAEAARRIAAKQLSPVELAKTHLDRIRRLDPQLNAFLLVTEERALADAKAAEARQMSGTLRGKLDGIPIAHKDIYNTAGIRTTAHSKLLEHNVPTRDAHTVKKWADAGTVMLGKLATHEFAFGGPSFDLPWPPARNPWNTEHFTAGSSSGTGRGRRRRPHPGRHRVRHRRIDPRTGGALRHRRHQADLWPVQPGRHPAAGLLARSRRPDGLDGGGLRAAAAGHGRPRSRGPGQRRSPGRRISPPSSARA